MASHTLEPLLMGRRQMFLKEAFKLAIRPLLTACSEEDISKAFTSFTAAECKCLHQLFIQVLRSLHENIEAEFESICIENQICSALDSLEQFVEEQNLDPLYSDKSSVIDISDNLSIVKKNEIQYLTKLLQTAKEQNHLKQARIELLKKGSRDDSGIIDATEKFRSASLNNSTYSLNGLPNA